MVLSGANAAIFVAELENPYPELLFLGKKPLMYKKEIEKVYNFLLVEYYNRNKDNFEKYGAEVNLNIPICKYEEDHQCRFDCPIFGVCEKNPC